MLQSLIPTARSPHNIFIEFTLNTCFDLLIIVFGSACYFNLLLILSLSLSLCLFLSASLPPSLSLHVCVTGLCMYVQAHPYLEARDHPRYCYSKARVTHSYFEAGSFTGLDIVS